MIAPWTFRCEWPVEDEALGYKSAVSLAESQINELADEAGARVVGPVEWSMVEHDADGWPHTPLALVATAEAVPARPTREHFPDLIRYYAGQGMTDPQIGALLGVPRDSIIYIRRKESIPPGCPPGHRPAA